MTYRVVYAPSVRADIHKHVRYLVEQSVSPDTIERWYNALFEAVDALYDMPRQHPVDASETSRQGFEVRKLTYHKYILRYRIDDERGLVEVLSFLHGARRRES